MTEREKDTEGFEAHFDAARRQARGPSDDLMRRVLADAMQVQSEIETASSSPRSRSGWARQLLGVLGGWPAVAGLSTAAVAGVWLGISPPAALDEVAQGILVGEDMTYLVDMSAEAAFGFDEGAM